MNNIQKKFVPVMITPYNLKARVDLETVSTLADFYIAAGAKGLFANCLSSEMYSLTEDE
ncbi:MAG: dihydrodipicolinate synthase family protein, partial [Chitinophagaceae bacterium]|nr:dihydrodipicolinate synthase family protein [Chitinophagaceae bacterium]